MCGQLQISDMRKVMERAAFWPRNFIETGTNQGETTLLAWKSGLFDSVVTVEKSVWLASQLRLPKEIRVVRGDSGLVLGDLITGPSFIYLDAHTNGWNSAAGFPLLTECAVIGKSAFPHVVVIDDLRLVGQKMQESWLADWAELSVEKILEAFGRPVKHWLEADHINVYLDSRHCLYI